MQKTWWCIYPGCPSSPHRGTLIEDDTEAGGFSYCKSAFGHIFGDDNICVFCKYLKEKEL